MTRDFHGVGLSSITTSTTTTGTTAVTRSAQLDAEDIEFMRWKAERWMKVRHMAAVARHDPGFVLRNGSRMLFHTFRGSTWRSALGLEDTRQVFQRYARYGAQALPRLARPSSGVACTLAIRSSGTAHRATRMQQLSADTLCYGGIALAKFPSWCS